jgi:hypothetical protein
LIAYDLEPVDAKRQGDEMPRYLIERVWNVAQEEEMAAKGPLSKQILADDHFSPVEWEHSHVVMGEDGLLRSYCVYSSPDTQLIEEHSKLLGDHMIEEIYEIGGDISPADFD